MYKIILLSFVFIITISCDNNEIKNDNIETVNIYDIKTVTGIYLRKSNNDEYLKLGNPYSKTESYLSIFPNPVADDVISISVNELYASNSNNSLSDVWFLKCNPVKTDNTIELKKIDYLESEINQKSNYHLKPNIENLNGGFFIDVRGYQSGYYKIFIKSNDTIVWDIIYIQEQDFSFEKFVEYWK